MPDRLASLFIQFCMQNGGRLSARKRADLFPGLSDKLAAALEQAVQASGITDPAAHAAPSPPVLSTTRP